jgi:hypothetical protein
VVEPAPSPTATPAEVKDLTIAGIQKEECIPEEIPIKDSIGTKKGLMWPRTYALSHSAEPLLTGYSEQGCPVDCGDDWTLDHIEQAILHGPHKSAASSAACAALHAEAEQKIANGFARVIRYGDIKDDLPKKLKISPVACIPHKSKKFRVILDLSFRLRSKNIVFPSVNETTNKLAPPESMVQLGNCVKRIISVMAENHDRDKPFKFCKLDIKDGFWRLVVNETDAWNFCYVLPPKDGKPKPIDDTLLVVPNSLQMGWCESPPFFCAASETARDVIATLLRNSTLLPRHKFEDQMLPLDDIEDPAPTEPQDPTLILEVFVDDFIGGTNDISLKHLTKVSRAMLHGVHSIFPPNEVTKHPGGDSIAEQKIAKGEGKWCFQKEILGWDFDGKEYTIQLPPDKCDKIVALIKKTIKQHSVPLKRFQELAGKLQHASMGIPGGAGLFSPMQVAMAGNPAYIILDPYLTSTLKDWRTIIQFLKHNPTSVLQLVAGYPHLLGYSDACKLGAGGVWSPGLEAFQYIVWQVEWPQDIRENLVTDDNPNGSLSINDLELAGIVLNFLALEIVAPSIKHKHVGTYCDNTSAVSWATKLRTSKSIPAARLLRMLGLRILKSQTSSLTTLNIPGKANDMADVSSRAFQNGEFFLHNLTLSQFFNSKFPLPKNLSWRELRIPQKLTSRVISCLRGEQLTMESLLRMPKVASNTGRTGRTTQDNGKKTPSSPMRQKLSKESFSQHLLQGSGQASTVEELKSAFQRSRKLSRPSPRPLNWQDNIVPSTGMRRLTSSRSKDVSRA